ncbi:hypothetical protein NW754_006985 [Fusarium falciforme]|nr:hypothetical protein NW754_006985 [Fusarium falciforme]
MTMEHETQTDKSPQCKDSQPSPPPPRRSRRLAAKPLKAADAPGTMGELRRNPKRKASEAANEVNHAISKESGQLLLNEALAPLSQEDIQEWEGWIALESEPAFFNIILRDLGVKDVKAQEIFTIDQDSLALLPQVCPVTLPLPTPAHHLQAASIRLNLSLSICPWIRSGKRRGGYK